jgi:hypothetical protein
MIGSGTLVDPVNSSESEDLPTSWFLSKTPRVDSYNMAATIDNFKSHIEA